MRAVFDHPMKRQLGYVTAAMTSVLAVACGGGGDDESPSDQVANKLQGCGLITEGRIDDFDSECAADCISEASCDELEAALCSLDFSQDVALCVLGCEASGDLFVCDNGEEVPGSWQCDGEADCDDESDEDGCGSTEFSCGDGETIPAAWECDGEADCDDESDEAGCASIVCE